jgi:inorganic pyrophosphatase
MFPLIISSLGICICLLCHFVATHIKPVKSEHDVEIALRLQLVLTTILMVPIMLYAVEWLPSEFTIVGVAKTVKATRMDGYNIYLK